jgi:hypothetical protein
MITLMKIQNLIVGMVIAGSLIVGGMLTYRAATVYAKAANALNDTLRTMEK